MIELPIRESTVTVDLEDENVPGLACKMQALTDGEAADLMSKSISAKEGVDVNVPIVKMISLFTSHFVEFVGDEVNIGGEPFNAGTEGHAASLPLTWKIKAVGGLIEYATALPPEMVKNSKAQVE